MRLRIYRYAIIFPLFFNCNHDSKHLITESTFKNKTFVSYYETEKDSLIIEFTDTTYQYINYSKEKRNWRITNYNDSDFLILDKIAIGIEQLNDSVFKCHNVSHNDIKFEMILKNPKWSEEKLYGKWVEDIYLEKSEDFFPPSPPPIPEKYDWPPYYEISEDKITNNHYNINESKYELNNSNEYLFTNLRSHIYNKEIKWRIKSVNDSVMIINRMIEKSNYKFEFQNTFSKDVKLIRINN